MDCYLSSFLALGLIGGSISTLSVNKQQHDILRNVFSHRLDLKYEMISLERRNHYLIGLGIGLILSTIIVNSVGIENYYTRVTLFLTITLGSAVLFYMSMPKSDYMLNHLKTPEENRKWLQVYNTMKNRYYLGFLLGILAAIPLANVLC
jgi:uncharacterized protein YacL